MSLLLADGRTHARRETVIDAVAAAASGAGAWLLDFEHFSNLASVFRFEVDGEKLSAVLAALHATAAQIVCTSPQPWPRTGTHVLVVHVQFIHSDAPLLLDKPIRC